MSDDVEEAMARASAQQRFGATPTASDEEEEKDERKGKAPQQQNVPERRYIDGRWLSYYGDNRFVEYIEDSWKPVSSDSNLEELKRKWNQVGGFGQQSSSNQAVKCVVNGVTMVWNPLGQTWIPDVDVNEDFLANYHSQYGVPTDYSSIPTPSESKKPAEAPLTKNEKRAKKREAAAATAERLKGWIQMNEANNTKVYISGLPTTITEEEYIALMSKYGLIMDDPRTNKPKVKLYKDAEGNLKGDGICCYVKVESVYLALQILDGMRYDDDHTITVERATFEIKGDYDVKKKKSRLTAAQKKKFLEKQEKQFEWKPDKPRNYRPVNECIVVLRNMFTLEEFVENPALILDLKAELKELYAKFGNLKFVIVYDTNPEGIVTLKYETVEGSDLAVKSLNGIIRHGRQISATLWDGKEEFKMTETAEEKALRENAWNEFLGVGKEESED